MSRRRTSKQPSYSIGNVGKNAKVQQGHHQTMTEVRVRGAASRDLTSVLQSLELLRHQIAGDPDATENVRTLSESKIAALEAALQSAGDDPDTLHLTLLDTESWLTKTAAWAWRQVRGVLTNEVGQKVISGIAEGAAKASIEALLRG